MAKKRLAVEQIIQKLREAELELAREQLNNASLQRPPTHVEAGT